MSTSIRYKKIHLDVLIFPHYFLFSHPFSSGCQVLLSSSFSPLPSTGRVREDSWHSASRRCFRAAAANQEPFEPDRQKNRPIGDEMCPAEGSPLLSRQGRVSCLQRHMLPSNAVGNIIKIVFNSTNYTNCECSY